MKHWRPVGFGTANLGPLSNIPYLKAQMQLSRIIEDIMNTIHLPKPDLNSRSLDYQLDKLNLSLDRWKQSLPHDMRGRDCASFETVPVPGYTTLQ